MSVANGKTLASDATGLLGSRPALSGLYVAGGGLSGVAQALEDRNRHLEVVLIGDDISGDMPATCACMSWKGR